MLYTYTTENVLLTRESIIRYFNVPTWLESIFKDKAQPILSYLIVRRYGRKQTLSLRFTKTTVSSHH